MKVISWFSVAIVVTACVGSLFYYKNTLSEQSLVSGPEPSSRVEALKVEQQNFQKRLFVTGEGRAVRHIVLRNELAGKLSRLTVNSGAKVHVGQVLLELEHSEEKAKLVAAKATVQLSQQTLTRYQRLLKDKRISQERVDVARAEFQIAKAEVARLAANIEKKVIKAPFDAQIGIHDLALGQFLDTNSEIFELIGDDGYVWVDFKVPQDYPELAIGSEVLISAARDKGIVAKVISRDPILSQNSRQLAYRAKVFKTKMNIKPNQLLKVAVPIMAEKPVIMLPKLAIVRDQLGDYVYKLIEDEQGVFRANRQKVTLGEQREGDVIVQQGLNIGEVVAVKGAFKLREGLITHFDNAQLVK